MRPQYQKYHEVRAEIDKLKAEITSLLGHFPSELEENRIGSTSTHNGNWNDHQSTPQNESSGNFYLFINIVFNYELILSNLISFNLI